MIETPQQPGKEKKPSQPCAWCGKPAASKCSQCGHLWVCGRECFKKVFRTHGRVCTRIRKKPYITSPESSMYGVGELDFEVAHRGLKGEYYLGEGGKPMMREPYECEEDRPDYLLVLPGVARKLVIEYMDVRSLRNTDMVVNNVYTLMAWHEALRGVFSAALSKWPLYQSTDDFKGLRWCMHRRVQVRNFKIWKVLDKQSGEEIRKDQGRIFEVLCRSKKYANIASLMVSSGSIDPNESVSTFGGWWSPLHLTAYYGRLDVAQALVEVGADIDKITDNGCTPLFIASQAGHVEVAKLLMEAGADIGNDGGFPPLFIASQNGHVEMAKVLIEAGADIDKPEDYGATPLYVASEKGDVDMARLLIEAGADIDKPEDYGATPLHMASQQGHVEMARLLIEAGADIDKAKDGWTTPLHMASQLGHVDVARLLIEAGADIDKARESGATPLWMASQKGYMDVARLLIEAGADIDKARDDRITPLYMASQDGHVDVARLLIEAGADIDKAKDDGATPLCIASGVGRVEVVRVLLNGGADATLANRIGMTPLMIAKQMNHPEIVALLGRIAK